MDRTRAALAVVLIVAVMLGAHLGLDPGRAGLAQDATPEAVVDPIDIGHPAHVHAGGCGDDLGPVVETLSDLTKTQGEEAGADGAIIASRSYTSVPMTLDALLAGEHSLNIHLSAEEIDTYLACGPIGGVVDINGALTIGLLDAGGPGNHSGIAYLSPDADGESTGILIFMTEDDATGSVGPISAATPVAADPVADDDTTVEEAVEDDAAEDDAAAEDEDSEAAEEETDEATAAPTEAPSLEETVEVSLTEWAIYMPTELPAGSVIFEVINDGTVPHTFEIASETFYASLDAAIGPGERARLEVDLEPGEYTAICSLGEGAHRDMGMNLTLTVE